MWECCGHVVGADGQLAMAAIDEHGQLNRLRPAEVDERVERRPNRAPRVQHVVHQQDVAAVDRERDVGAAHERLRADGQPHQIVAVERDVECARRHLGAADVAQHGSQPPGKRHPARADAHQRDVVDAAVVLDDFMRHARETARHAIGVHHDGHEDTGRDRGCAE